MLLQSLKYICFNKEIIVAIYFPFILSSCAFLPPPKHCVKDGKQYCVIDDGIMSANWYNYFNRGISCMEGGCFEEAIDDFYSAIKEREKDTYSPLQMYGLRYLTNYYFPHREAGISFYMLGQFEAAMKELKISLSHEESAKSRYYLNLTQKKIWEKQGIKGTLPNITLNQLKQGIIQTNLDPVTISGVADDPWLISDININDKKVFIEKAEKRIFFTHSMRLNQGKHNVNVIARSLAGKESNLHFKILVDRKGPGIVIKSIHPEKGISILLTDETDIQHFSVNDKEVDFKKSKQVELFIPYPPHLSRLIFVAKDSLNNSTFAIFSEEMLNFKSHLLANALQYSQQQYDDNPLVLSKSKNLDIKTTGFQDFNTVYLKKINIDYAVYSKYPIQSFTLNNLYSNIGNTGRFLFSSDTIALAPGKNKIVLSATNIKNQQVNKKLIIERKIPEINLVKHRCVLSIISEEKTDQSILFYNYFIPLLKKRKRFQILFQSSAPTEKTKFLYIDIYESRFGTEISMTVGNKSQTYIENKINAFSNKKGKDMFDELSKHLCNILHEKYPMVQTSISDITQNTFIAKTSKTKQLQLHWPLLIFSETDKKWNQITGKSWGCNLIKETEAEIVEINKNTFQGKCLKDFQLLKIKKLGVITQ